MDKNRSNTNVAAIYPADVVTSKTIDAFSHKENADYEHLQKWYLEKQVRTGSGAELPSDIQLRRMVRASKIEAYPNLKNNLADYESNSSSRSTRIGIGTSCSRNKNRKRKTNANQKNKQEREKLIMLTKTHFRQRYRNAM